MGFVLQLMQFVWKYLIVFHDDFIFFLPEMFCLLKKEKIRVKHMFKDIIIEKIICPTNFMWFILVGINYRKIEMHTFYV